MANLFDDLIDETRLQEEPALKRYGKQFVRGATLGFGGAKQRPETPGEYAAEFAGGILPVAAISAVASPLAGAGLRLLNVPRVAIPLASRLTTASAVGGATTAGYDISEEGSTSLGRVGLGAGLGVAQEALFLGGTRLFKKARALSKTKVPESPTAPVVADTIDEAISPIRALPSARQTLALPAMGETTVSTRPDFEVGPRPTRMSGRMATGRTPYRIKPFEEPGLLREEPTLSRTFDPETGMTTGLTETGRIGKTQRIAEVDKRTGVVKLLDLDVEQTKAKFHVGRDPETGIPELISKDSLTDAAIDLASRPSGWTGKVFRGDRETRMSSKYATDPGDLGAGIYYTTSRSYAAAYAGKRGILSEKTINLENPLVLNSDEAVALASRYRTVEGKTIEERILGANRMTADLQIKGYDGLVVHGYEGSKNTTTVVVFPRTEINPQILNANAKAKLDINAKSEPFQIENILKQPEPVASKLLDPDVPPKMTDYVKLNYTPEAIEAMTIAKKIGMDDATLTAFMEAGQQIKDQVKRNQVILDSLKRFCVGGSTSYIGGGTAGSE